MKKFLAIFFTLLIASAAVLFIWHFTDHFNSDFRTFYVTYGGDAIMSSEADVAIEEQTEEKFEVKYPFDTAKRDYSVSITPNPDVDLQYTVGTSIKRWSGEKNAEKLFEIKKEEASFTLTSKYNYGSGIEEILALLYPGEQITLLSDPPEKNIPLCILTVTSYNAEIKYSIKLRVTNTKISAIETTIPEGDIYF